MAPGKHDVGVLRGFRKKEIDHAEKLETIESLAV